MTKRKYTNYEKVEILNDMKMNNLSVKQIAMKRQLSESTIYKWMKELGYNNKSGKLIVYSGKNLTRLIKEYNNQSYSDKRIQEGYEDDFVENRFLSLSNVNNDIIMEFDAESNISDIATVINIVDYVDLGHFNNIKIKFI